VTQNFSPELAFEQLAPSEDGKIIGKQSEWKSMKVKNAEGKAIGVEQGSL